MRGWSAPDSCNLYRRDIFTTFPHSLQECLPTNTDYYLVEGDESFERDPSFLVSLRP